MSYTPQSPNSTDSQKSEIQSLDSLPTDEFLRIVGQRVRNQRSAMSMSRKRLAEVSGVSERYLAQLESGQGNMSIALLRKVTNAIDLSLAVLLSGDTPELIKQADVADAVPNSTASETPSYRGAGSEQPDNKNKLVSEL